LTTHLDRQTELEPVDKQADDEIVPLCRFGKTDGFSHQPFDPCAQREMFAFQLLRPPLAESTISVHHQRTIPTWFGTGKELHDRVSTSVPISNKDLPLLVETLQKWACQTLMPYFTKKSHAETRYVETACGTLASRTF